MYQGEHLMYDQGSSLAGNYARTVDRKAGRAQLK
jgi:hypothetical protein